MVLAAYGGALGLLFAYWATGSFIAIGGDSIPRPEAITIDARVLLFTLAISAVCALLAGLVPALQASRPDTAETLKEGGRVGTGLASRRTRSVLFEVALAFVLLAGAALLLRSLWTMGHIERGFRTDRVATARLSLPAALYAGPADVRGFYARLLDRLRALPGVESAATGTGVLLPPLANSNVFTIEGKPPPLPGERVEYPIEAVSTGYFETLGITPIAGRTFNDQDRADAPGVVIINETLARLGWPGQDPLGRRMRGGGENSRAPWLTVIGVVPDLRRADVRRAIRPEVYLTTLQLTPRSQMVLVRTAGDAAAIVPSIRREVQALDPALPLFAVGTLNDQVSATLTSPRFRAVLLAAFAGIAALLAAIGIYGVTAHAVGQRTQELGVRMALGARRVDVLGLVLAQHLRPAAIGLAVGFAAALAVNRSLRTLVYGVGVSDPARYLGMAAALLVVAAVACFIPALRATRVDPLAALRTQ